MKIDELDLLRLLGKTVLITSVIREEIGQELPKWISVVDPDNNKYQKILEMDLDRGEASAIALSLNMDNSILIIDDLKGRKVAEALGLRFSGTFGLILHAKRKGIIDSVKPLIQKIKSTNFRFNESLINWILKESDEFL